MYIKDQRIRTKRALYKGGRGIAGLGDACTDMGGQTQADGTCHIELSSNAGPATSTSSWLTGAGAQSSSSSPQQSNAGFSDVLAATAGAIGKIFGSQPQTVIAAPSSGISPTTLLVVGGLGLGAILLLTRKSS